MQGRALIISRMTAIPQEIGQMTSLEWLNLIGNQLTTIPDFGGHLKTST